VKTFSKIEASNAIFLIQSFLFTLLLLTVVAIFIGKFVFQPLVLVTEWLCKAIYIDCVKRG
jgi:hypothetical protein